MVSNLILVVYYHGPKKEILLKTIKQMENSRKSSFRGRFKKIKWYSATGWGYRYCSGKERYISKH
jgi:hypothetical protein